MNRAELMREAHKLTRKIKSENPSVNYSFQLGLCLTYLHQESKRVEKVLNKLGCKTWTKGSYRRVYINDIEAIAVKIGYELPHERFFKRTRLYFDCTCNLFFYDTTPSRKPALFEVLKLIRKQK